LNIALPSPPGGVTLKQVVDLPLLKVTDMSCPRFAPSVYSVTESPVTALLIRALLFPGANLTASRVSRASAGNPRAQARAPTAMRLVKEFMGLPTLFKNSESVRHNRPVTFG
jgi:hypothetical protein